MNYVILKKAKRYKSVGIDFDGTIVKVNDNLSVSKCKVMAGAREALQKFKDEALSRDVRSWMP